MITKIKHFFVGGLVSGALFANKNVYVQIIGGILLGYLVICGLERLFTRLVEMADKYDE